MSTDNFNQVVLQTIIGAFLVGASIPLTFNSSLRLAVLRTNGSKMFLFPIMNITMLINEFALIFMVFSNAGIASLYWFEWTTFINNLCYFFTKPILLYLAYLRCRAVYEPYQRYKWLHYTLIAVRALELWLLVVANLYDNMKCGDKYQGTICGPLDTVWKIRDGMATVFRIYYIVSESIFYVKLFHTLRIINKANSPNINLLRYRTYQTVIFSLDLIFLTAMCIYRIIGLTTTLPPYTYWELFSTAWSVFCITEFGLTLSELFKPQSQHQISSRNPPNPNIILPTPSLQNSSSPIITMTNPQLYQRHANHVDGVYLSHDNSNLYQNTPHKNVEYYY